MVLVYLIDMVSVSGPSIDKLNHEVSMHAVEPWQKVIGYNWSSGAQQLANNQSVNRTTKLVFTLHGSTLLPGPLTAKAAN